MPKVKCKHCGKTINSKNAIFEEYFTTTLRIMKRYFCSEECKRNYNFEKIIKDEFYFKCSELIGVDLSNNRYFKERFSEIESKEQAYLLIYKHAEEMFCEFNESIKKVQEKGLVTSYRIAVLINIIKQGISKYFNEDILKNYNSEEIILEDYIDYESLMPKGKQVKERKTIFDLEG